MGQKIKVGKRIKREFSLTGDNRTELERKYKRFSPIEDIV